MIKKLTLLLSVAALVLLMSACNTQKTNSSTVCGSFNGESITTEELGFFILRNRASVLTYYADQYGIYEGADFWEHDFGDGTPKQTLEQAAFDDAVKAKAEFCLMRENGIYDEISYSALMEKAENYNYEHRNDPDADVIQTAGADNFYYYYLTKGRTELQSILAKDVLKPTDEEIENLKKTSNASSMTDEAIISYIVSEKYSDYINDIVSNAAVEQKEFDWNE